MAKHFKSWDEYECIKGFYDLRDYKIPAKEFIKLWDTQKYLKKEQDKYFSLSKINQKANQSHWNELKILSSQYQQVLFKYTKTSNMK